jgi:hypothetical protein
MRKSLATLADGLSCLAAFPAAPASAQTQGQTYAFGRADFCAGPVEARRALRLWLTGPNMYEFIYGAPTPPRPLVIACDPVRYGYAPRDFTAGRPR